MPSDEVEIAALLSDVERSIERSTKLELATVTYLLQMAALDIRTTTYSKEVAADTSSNLTSW